MQAVTFFFAFVVVLALIGVAAWLVRRFAGNRLGANPNRGRMPRLAVIDAAAVDGRRRLVLVRRDNVEHLLMIGGPTDIVVESNIVRATAGRDQLPQRSAGTELPPRIAPLPDATNWAEEAVRADIFAEPQMPEPPPRPMRPSFAEEARRPAPTLSERRGDPLAGFGQEPLNLREPRTAPPSLRPEPRPEPLNLRPEPRPEPLNLRPEPRPEPLNLRPEPRPEPLNLRPEPRPEPLSLRPEPRPELRAEPGPESRPEVRPELRPEPIPRMPRGEPLMPRTARQSEAPKAPPLRAAERPAAPPPPPPVPAPAPQPSADQNLAEMAQRLEAALRRPAAEAMAPPVAPEPPPGRAAPRAEPSPAAAAPPQAVPAKTSFENLEDEMASLLGRPKSQSS
jgi:flagellar protein FliO/FliZ